MVKQDQSSQPNSPKKQSHPIKGGEENSTENSPDLVKNHMQEVENQYLLQALFLEGE